MTIQCAVCKYKDNCKPRADEPLLTGCTSGHPIEFIDQDSTWVFCSICGEKTYVKIRPDTEAKNLDIFPNPPFIMVHPSVMVL